MALERRAILHSRGKEPARDLHRGSWPVPKTPVGHSRECFVSELSAIPNQSRDDDSDGRDVMAPGETLKIEAVEMVASRHPRPTPNEDRLLDAVHFRYLIARGTLFTVQKALPLLNVFVGFTNRFVWYRSR